MNPTQNAVVSSSVVTYMLHLSPFSVRTKFTLQALLASSALTTAIQGHNPVKVMVRGLCVCPDGTSKNRTAKDAKQKGLKEKILVVNGWSFLAN